MFNIETVTSLDNFYKYDDYWKSSFIISFKEFGFERSDDDQHMYESIDCYDDDSHNSADSIHEIEKPSSFNTLHEFAFDYDDEKDSDNMSVDDLQELQKPCSNTFNSGLAKKEEEFPSSDWGSDSDNDVVIIDVKHPLKRRMVHSDSNDAETGSQHETSDENDKSGNPFKG